MAISPKTLLPFLLGATLMGLAPASGAAADTPISQDRASIDVSLADLDLSREPDARIAVDRIERAARKVCRSVASRSVLAPRAVHDCQRETLARTIEEIGGDRPMLAELVEETSGQN